MPDELSMGFNWCDYLTGYSKYGSEQWDTPGMPVLNEYAGARGVEDEAVGTEWVSLQLHYQIRSIPTFPMYPSMCVIGEPAQLYHLYLPGAIWQITNLPVLV